MTKLDQDLFSAFFHEDPTSSIYVILITNRETAKQINSHENNTSFAEVITLLLMGVKGHLNVEHFSKVSIFYL